MAAQNAIITEEEHPEIIEHEGWMVDAETGEQLYKLEWHPKTREEVEWVLGKIASEESNVHAINARRQALLDNLAAQEKKHVNRITDLLGRFAADIEQFARGVLEAVGWKTKTAQFDNGKVSFRELKGTNRIIDMDSAVDWAERNGHANIVKVTKSVTVTDILANADDDTLAGLRDCKIIESTGPQEKCSIETGVGR